MSKQDEDRSAWQPFIEKACASLGVDPELVDVDAILELTGIIAHEAARPMAPVGAFMVGLAAGRAGSGADVDELIKRLVETVRS